MFFDKFLVNLFHSLGICCIIESVIKHDCSGRLGNIHRQIAELGYYLCVELTDGLLLSHGTRYAF